ncbi:MULTISPECIES: DUF262 domain-containing protein [unclassified Agrobacterium]
MKPYTRSVIDLFDGKKRFLIPLYQRKYAWNAAPQLELLWEDITRSMKRLMEDRSTLTPHFMGAMVIAQVKTFGKEVQAFEIIDGQQRLTTFQLLLAALRDVAKANGSRYESEIQKYLLNDGIMEHPEVERFKLWPSLTDRRSFVTIIDPDVDVESYGPSPVDEDGFVRRSVAAHAYLKDKIEKHVNEAASFDEHKLEILFEALKDGLAIVSIELEGGDDPQTIFETLNSRGVDLSASDLMRNFIFQRAKGLGQENHSLVVDKLYEKHWLPLDRAFWSQPASRGRQTRTRLDWMLTDHLAMHTGELVSVENLFERYRRWILDGTKFTSVTHELESISATAAIEKRLFDQSKDDPIGNFGRLADAFDVSTAMPLVLYLATEADIGADLTRALNALESFILRRDICGLPTKAYNRFFVGIIDRMRRAEYKKTDALLDYLSSRTSENDRWPNDHDWELGWVGRDQYKGPRQARLRYILEAIEMAKRSKRNEDITINSTLTIEHIMPQQWEKNWPLSEFNQMDDAERERDIDYMMRKSERASAINRLGNLTLLTHALNSSVSNGAYSVKMPAVRSHSSLALNRELYDFDDWNEASITSRGLELFGIAKTLWDPPLEQAGQRTSNYQEGMVLPGEGTKCKFTYGGVDYQGAIQDGQLWVSGYSTPFGSFSAASRGITNTSRNGWNDWYLRDSAGDWVLAADWRMTPA